MAEVWIGPVAGSVGAAVFLGFALRAGRRQRLVDNLPTGKTTGVFIGLVELKGTAEAEQPLQSYLTGTTCVYHKWTVEEHWSRTVTETYRDNAGNTRTRRESGWTTVANGDDQTLFYLQDECGVIRVNPNGAKIEPKKTLAVECGPGDALYYGKGPAGAILNSDLRRRFVEHQIPLHAPVYVMGQARERDDVVAAEIANDAKSPIFLISTRTEEQVSTGMRFAFWGLGMLGLIAVVIGFVVLERGIASYIVAGGSYLAAWGAGWVWMVYNSAVELRQRVRQAWSNVDVQLKRRADLIPNLVHAVEGMRDHESETQTAVAQLRGQLEATPPGKPGVDPQACVTVIRAVAERYPELKANSTFMNLQENLVDTENRIALARAYFNEIATHYNTRLQTVPDGLVARLGSLEPRTLMAAADFERAPVEVNLAR